MLHTGLNIFQWKTMGIEASHRPKPVMIKRIEIEGETKLKHNNDLKLTSKYVWIPLNFRRWIHQLMQPLSR